MSAGPRERLIDSAIALVRERGVHGTGLAELLEHSRTARGSVYQHFPGGKAELIEHATVAAGERMAAVIASLDGSGGPPAVIDGLVAWWRKALTRSSYAAGCPVVAAALAGSDSPAARDAAGTVLAAWRDQLAAGLRDAGVEPAAADSLGGFVVSALEGAVIVCRATRSLRPLDEAAGHLKELVVRHLPRA